MAVQDQQAKKDFIERIRRTFLVGDDVPEHLREGARNLQTQLNNALRLLSEDLYSKKSHFVLELVQNADDNRYESGVTPELTLVVEPERLTLFNNETGFSEENISAICKVGASSKAKDKQHHIGEKGIGFKSVFSVSDAPEIHSNGFHFRFDRTDPTNLLGYVVPTWCDGTDEVSPRGTCIVLPASAKYRFGADTLAGLDSRVLLFLNKLKQLALNHGGIRTTHRRSEHKGVSHLATAAVNADDVVSESHLRFLRVTQSIDMTGEYSDEKRPDVTTSTVVLALPIESSGVARLEHSAYVFAYLPVHQAGFSFPLHADFILNSGREAVLNDRPWNIRLRDGIAEAFVAGLAHFRKSAALGLTYLKYIPDRGEVSDDFFGAVRQQIIAGLRSAASLPSASGTWRAPSELRRAHERFRTLLPSSLTKQLFDFDYIDERVHGSAALLQELGVEAAGYDEVLQLFKNNRDWLAKQPLEWRARLYAFIAEDVPGYIKAGLLNVPCIPTTDSGYVIPAESAVFFPLAKGKKYGFEHELTILDEELYSASMAHSPATQHLFDALKVRQDDPFQMVVGHILPKHADESWKRSKHTALVGHLRYIKDKIDLFVSAAAARGHARVSAFQSLRQGLWVGTKQVDEAGAWTFNRVDRLYLAKEYKSEFCLESLLAGALGADAYVSAEYLAKKPQDPEAEAASWRSFFSELGVRLVPAVVEVGSDWHCSKELSLLLAADSNSTRRLTLEWLSKNWQHYAPKIAYSSGRSRYESTFLRQLRATEAPLLGRRGTAPLPETYYRAQELKEILGDDLPYLDAFLEPGMLEACRVTHRLNAKALVKRLVQLKASNAGTVTQIRQIYRVLERLWDTDEHFIQLAFEENGLIQLKGTHKGWYSPSQVSWRSADSFIDSLYPPLEGPFRDFQGLFIDKLGIPRELPLASWADALTQLDSIADRTARESQALAIYKRMDRALRPKFGKPVPRPDWLDVLEQEAVFVDQHGALVEADENLLANDRPEIAALFMGEETLSFLAVPNEEVPRLSELLGACGVQLFSEVAEFEVECSDEGVLDVPLTERVQRLVPYIARVLYAKLPAELEEALAEKRIAWLWHLEVIEVAELNHRVTLGEFEATTHADAALADGNILYRSKATSLKDRVASELSKYLVGTTELSDSFVRLLLEESLDDVEEVLRVRGIGPLPADLSAAVMQRELPEEHRNQEDSEEASASEDEPDEDVAGSPAQVEDSLGSVSAADADSRHSPEDVDVSLTSPATNEPTPEPASVAQGGAPASSNPETAEPALRPVSPPRPAGSSPLPAGAGREHPVGGASPNPPTTRLPSGTGGSRAPSGTTPVSSPPAGPAPTSSNGAALVPTTVNAPSVDAPRLPSPPRPLETGPGTGQRPYGVPDGRSPGNGSARTPTHQPRTRSGRLLSYVEGPSDTERRPDDVDTEGASARDAVGKAAVAHALSTLAPMWASLTEMPHSNPGYDVLARTAAGTEEFIEVKGQSGAWTHEGVALTPTELSMAQRAGERYWLCVVEFALDDRRREVSVVKNPFGLTQQFRFDVGWKAAADKISSVPLIPDKGLYVDIADVGLGRILSVRGKGKFFNVHVILRGGNQVNITFNPAKMKLSKEPLWQE